jgi:hypothetical protein
VQPPWFIIGRTARPSRRVAPVTSTLGGGVRAQVSPSPASLATARCSNCTRPHWSQYSSCAWRRGVPHQGREQPRFCQVRVASPAHRCSTSAPATRPSGTGGARKAVNQSQQGRFAPARCAAQSARQGLSKATRSSQFPAPPCFLPMPWVRVAPSKPGSPSRETKKGATPRLPANALIPRRPPPNPSLNRRPNGMSPWPRGACGSSSASRPRRHAVGPRLAPR